MDSYDSQYTFTNGSEQLHSLNTENIPTPNKVQIVGGTCSCSAYGPNSDLRGIQWPADVSVIDAKENVPTKDDNAYVLIIIRDELTLKNVVKQISSYILCEILKSALKGVASIFWKLWNKRS